MKILRFDSGVFFIVDEIADLAMIIILALQVVSRLVVGPAHFCFYVQVFHVDATATGW
jgi:hypothetical protein